MSNGKFAERLTILNELGEGMLIRLYNVRTKYEVEGVPKPAFMSDQTYAKVMAALMRKFPEIPPDLERVPGYDLFMGRAPQLYEEIEADYDTFVDLLDWNKTSLNALTDIAKGVAGLQMEENPLLTAAFLDLYVLFCQINILVGMISNRNALVAAFGRIYFTVKCSPEPNWNKVAQYMIRYANPFVKLSEVVKPLSKRLGQALLSTGQAYMKINDLQLLRKEGCLSPYLNPDKMALPSQDLVLLNFFERERMYQWIIWGYLFCTEELASNGALQLVKMALAFGFRVPVFRELTIPIFVYYDASWKNFKSKTLKLAKERKIISDAVQAAVTGEGANHHKSMRVYLRQSLSNLLSLIKDFPGLLGPKITMVWAGLNAAKAEILWYFRHIGAPVPKTKDKFDPEEFRDKHISELIYLCNELIAQIRQHQRVIQAYYLEYLRGADLADFERQVSRVPSSSDCGPLLQEIARELRSINVDAMAGGAECNLQGLRLNWFRVESRLSSTSSTIIVSQVKELVHRGRLISLHSRNVDQIEEMIDEFASLKMLWYFKEKLLDTFDKSILEGPKNPLFCMTYLHLLAEFPENATPYLPEEKEAIGPECVKLAQNLLEKITQRIASVVMEIGKNFLAFHDQIKAVNAAYPLLQRVKDYKFDKNFVPPTTPGAESQHRNRQQLDGLRLYERNVWQLCAAMQEFVEVSVYDHKLVPREFLRDKLSAALRTYVKQAIVLDPQNHVMQRPSVLENQLQMFFSTIKLVENFVDLDVGDLIREVLLKQCYNKSISEVNKIDWTAEGEVTWGSDVHLMKYISKWYGEFVSKRLASPGICYSPNRRAFISLPGNQFRADDYTDFAELQALVRLVGPYGVKAIDREVMKYIVDNISGVKGVVRQNRQALEDISNHYHEDVSAQIKSLREVDDFVARSVAIGNALQFRQLLHEAQRSVAEQDIPYIFSTVRGMFEQYPTNTFMKPEFLEMDALAMSVGLDVGTADQAVKAVLSKSIGEQDRPLWRLLPFMYAASFISSRIWGEAQYRSTIDAPTNNAHSIALTIHALMISIEATSEGGQAEIVHLLRKFVEASSCILLRQAQQSAKALERTGIQSFPSILIFLDKFIQDSPVLTQDMLESCMPYALLRQQYKELFEVRGKGKKGATQEDL